MSLLDDIRARFDRRRDPRQVRAAWPAGPAVVEPFDKAFGHDDEQYSPESYGDFLVTSNEIFSAASLRARLASTVRLRLYQGRDEAKREMGESAPARLLDWVNPHWTPAQLARMDELAMCLWGESYWAVEKKKGRPSEIWWLKPSRVKPVPHEKDYLEGFLYESNVNGVDIRFDPDEIVWQRYPNPLDEFSAVSPVAAARLAAETASEMMKANRNLHKEGLQIAGVVAPMDERIQYTPEQAKQLEEELQRRFAGASRAHRWAVLRYQAKFQPVNITPKDAEFLGGLGLTLRQVCNAYGIPSPLQNDLEHATLANLREFSKHLWETALVPDMTLRSQFVEEQFLPMFGRGRTVPDHVEYDFGTVTALQESASETWDRERQAIDVGAMTINEWRAKKGMPPVKWGDVYWAPVNKAPVQDGTTAPTAATPAEGAGDRTPAGPDDGVDAGMDPMTEQAWRELLATFRVDRTVDTTVNGVRR